MEVKNLLDLFLLFTCGLILLLGGFDCGTSRANKDWTAGAIKHNAGQFVVVNKAKGTTEFKWNDEIPSTETKK